jgi:hypothetical protein
MSRSVERIVASARDRHPAFDVRRHPSGPVYRFLADYVAELQAMIASLTLEGTTLELTIDATIPLADFEAGIDLGATRTVTEVVGVDPTTKVPQRTYPIELISAETRLAPNAPRASAWVDGETLFLMGPESRWKDLGSISVKVLAEFGDADADALARPRAVLPLPDQANRAVIENLALFMAKRAPKSDGIDVQSFKQEARDAEERFGESLITRMQETTFTTVDTYRP